MLLEGLSSTFGVDDNLELQTVEVPRKSGERDSLLIVSPDKESKKKPLQGLLRTGDNL